MGQLVDWISTILIVILTGVNWTMYHKMFKITYFGNAFSQIMIEIVICGLVACLEVSILKMVFDFVFPILVFVAGCGIVFVIIKTIVANNSGNVSENNENSENS